MLEVCLLMMVSCRMTGAFTAGGLCLLLIVMYHPKKMRGPVLVSGGLGCLLALMMTLPVDEVTSPYHQATGVYLGDLSGGYLVETIDSADNILVYVKDKPHVEYGQVVTLEGLVALPYSPGNRYGFKTKAYDLAMGIGGRYRADSLILGETSPQVKHWGHVLRGKLVAKAHGLSPEAGLLFKALFLGIKDDASLVTTIEYLGLNHLFVVSGFHFSMVMVLVERLSRLGFKRFYGLHLVLCITGACLYFSVIAFSYGALKALFVLMIALGAFFSKRKYQAGRSVLIFVVVTAFISPMALNLAGYQLSVVATLVVILCHDLIKSKAWSKSLKGLVMAAGVMLGVSPLLVIHGMGVTLTSFLLASLLTPLMTLYLGLSFIYALLIRPLPSGVIVYLMETSASLLARIAYSLEALGGHKVTMVPAGALVLALFMGGGYLLYSSRRMGSRVLGFSLVMALTGICLLSRQVWGTQVMTFDLRDGEAYVWLSPDAVIMYDVGNDPQLVHELKTLGVKHIDLLVISHAHQDHMGLLSSILDQFEVGELVVEARQVQSRDYGQVGVKFAQSPQDFEDVNDMSIAMQIEGQGHRVLLTGDLESQGTSWMMSVFNEPVTLLKAPHHGSYNDHYKAMLDLYDPQVVWISGGRGKRVNKAQTLNDLHDKNVVFYDTMVDGELLAQLTPTNLKIKLLE